MHTPFPTTHSDTETPCDRNDDDSPELTREEEAALAQHHRHISETSYLPATADYLHVC